MTDAEPATKTITERANIKSETVGSDRYKQDHMGLIFQDGLSFSGFERNKFFVGDGDGRFVDLSDVSGADSEMDCRAACIADFDDDGDLDLFVNSIQRRTHLLYRNNLNVKERFVIKLRLRATSGHADAIGATVTLTEGGKILTRVVSCGSGFESQHTSEIVFGVKNREPKVVTVWWPGGKKSIYQLRAETSEEKSTGRYLLVEGDPEPKSRPKRTFVLTDEKKQATGLSIGKTLPQLVFKNSAVKSTPFNSVDKRPTLINFWSTTCIPCLHELPDLETLHDGGKYRIQLVDMDGEKNPARVLEMLQKLAPSLAHGSLDASSLERLFGRAQTPLPTTILLEPGGRIKRIIRGPISLEDL